MDGLAESSWYKLQAPVLDLGLRFGEGEGRKVVYGWVSSFFSDTLSFPFILVLFLLLIHFIHGLRVCVSRFRRSWSLSTGVQDNLGEDGPKNQTMPPDPATFQFYFAHRIPRGGEPLRNSKEHGGWVIFAYSAARLLGCLALLGLSLNTLLRRQELGTYVNETGSSEWTKDPEIYMTVTYVYASSLSILSMYVHRWATYTRRCSTAVLLYAFGVYIYRDLWPLATYTQHPEDLPREGNLIWVKIFILGFVTVFIPLFIPRRYIPVDTEDPMPIPNDEQTCSIASLLFFSYLDPVIFKGYSVTHLSPEELPPLSDTDYAKNLVKKHFPNVDPYMGAKKGHLFFGLMKVFKTEYTLMGLSVLGQNISEFFNPIAINRLLKYMETGGEGFTVRPWVWIVLLFLGPTISEILFELYVFLATRALTHTQALITQLVFEHSLRIRLVSEERGDEKDAEGGPQGPDHGPLVTEDQTSSVSETESVESVDSNEIGSSATAGERTTSTPGSAAPTVTSKKGKGKHIPPPPISVTQPDAKRVDATKKGSNLIGKINNLVTTDLGNIIDARNFLYLILEVPTQITLSTFFLYQLLGWSTFVGLFFMIVLLPVPGYVAKLIQDMQKKKMEMTDARVQDVTEVLSVIRMIKIFGWEERMSKRIQGRRNNELEAVWKLKVLQSLTRIANSIIPTISMVATFATYTAVMKQPLTPSTVFSSLTVFSILRSQLASISGQITTSIQGKVSLDRISQFLRKTELLDAFAEKTEISGSALPIADEPPNVIGFKNATFSWHRDADDSGASVLSLQRRPFKLRIADELHFKTGSINLVVGPTGSGKTSILMALLGEMHFMSTGPDSWFNLPRSRGIAYAAQESWVQNDTVRENILFGSPYDETRYRKVLHQCALERDLELFDAGDATEVGEKGITLSGGQKARVTLARAIYSNAKILLLDDVLAALDVHTAAWIVNKCFRGDLVEGRTILLVTHNVRLTAPIAGFVVSMRDGTVKNQGQDVRDVLENDPTIRFEPDVAQEELETANKEAQDQSTKEMPVDGKLVIAEEISQGHVTWKSYKLFLSSLGGDSLILFYSLWLCYWGSQYETRDPSEVAVTFYLSLYTSIVMGTVLINTASYILFVIGTMRASRRIHSALVTSVLSSTLRWLDETPTSRIITRCTQDIGDVDGPVATTFLVLSGLAVGMAINVGVIMIFTPIFLILGFIVAALGLHLGNIYLKAQLSVKREMSNARAPVLGHFSAAISGMVSLRAYGAQIPFMNESFRRTDIYLRIARISYNLNRWIGIRISFLGSFFTVALASYLVYWRNIGSANTGFSLALATEFCSNILWWVRFYNDFEIQANSLERIQSYIDIDHEAEPTEEGIPPAAWPTSGDIVVENLSARYSKNGPTILHDISFKIHSGQRVGIVGRTGSGKSSLTLALLRCILTDGTVYYDGIPTNKINLDALRSNITIIPQSPDLISGTLRRNLDPFEQYDDPMLNDALRSAGLFNLEDEEGHPRVTLDSKISSGGNNLSVGEKQIIALARAMVRGSKLLILDEATSAIDYKTDAIIQTNLRGELAPDVTVITVAHRLQTIMDADKIMVLEDGRMIEFDSPWNLLQKDGSLLKALVDESGDKSSLYSVAQKKALSS